MAPSSDLVEAYENAKEELSGLINRREEIEKRIVPVRKSILRLSGQCEIEGIQVVPSAEALYLLNNLSLADEVRGILKSAAPTYMRPYAIKCDLECLGHDLSKYQNPQSTIQMVLKRMAESGEVQEGIASENGRKAYRVITINYDDLIDGAVNRFVDK
jgi:hypothetical protein